jgi:DNA-directed RNA polymerase specialized sigma subunit
METKDEDNFKGMNQREVAEALGVSRTAVQQAEKRAMKKILKLLAKRKIKREDFFD